TYPPPITNNQYPTTNIHALLHINQLPPRSPGTCRTWYPDEEDPSCLACARRGAYARTHLSEPVAPDAPQHAEGRHEPRNGRDGDERRGRRWVEPGDGERGRDGWRSSGARR